MTYEEAKRLNLKANNVDFNNIDYKPLNPTTANVSGNFTGKVTGLPSHKDEVVINCVQHDRKHVNTAILPKFQFSVENNTKETVKVALIPAYLRKLGFQSTEVNGKQASKLVYHNPNFYREAGYNIDVLLDDADVPIDPENPAKGSVKMRAANPTKTIGNFLSYITTNPIRVAEMAIVASDPSAFNADIELTSVNPFNRGAERSIELQKFVSAYQNNEKRITLGFGENDLVLSDTLLMAMSVPSGVTMDITFRFYE